VLFPDDYVKNKEVVSPDAIVFVKGRVDRRREEPSLRATLVTPLEQAQEEYARRVTIRLRCAGLSDNDLDVLRDVIRNHRGPVPVYIEMLLPNNSVVLIRTHDAMGVRPDGAFMQAVEELAGRNQVRLSGANGGDQNGGNGGLLLGNAAEAVPAESLQYEDPVADVVD